MIPILDELRQETRCHGVFRGQRFELTGGGVGRPFDGLVDTDLTTAIPLPFPPAVLAPVLIMGYPTFSTYHPGAFDLFKLSDGYTYDRQFRFENGGTMRSTHRVEYLGDYLRGDFEVLEAEADLPDLIACEPTIESFFPGGPGVIDSRFEMVWRTGQGRHFHAEVSSTYRLTHNATIPYTQFRYITFDGKYTSQHVQQREQLNVFRDIRRLSFPRGPVC
ncbi:MAG: hypothetical protein JO013_13355 [Alphaproteobacteria bacterium]|nr:hypothetical protein [Alphaproteobacteria bacterium]